MTLAEIKGECLFMGGLVVAYVSIMSLVEYFIISLL